MVNDHNMVRVAQTGEHCLPETPQLGPVPSSLAEQAEVVGSSPSARQPFDMLGQRFGRLLVLDRAAPAQDGRAWYRCSCDCGAEVTVRGDRLRSGKTTSCGCFQRRQAEAAQYRRWQRQKYPEQHLSAPK